jgi:hypothetical protein
MTAESTERNDADESTGYCDGLKEAIRRIWKMKSFGEVLVEARKRKG